MNDPLMPPMPEKKIVDLWYRYKREFDSWHTWWDESSSYFDGEKTRYHYVWAEYSPQMAKVPDQPLAPINESFRYERYRLPTELYQTIIGAKCLEKALESY